MRFGQSLFPCGGTFRSAATAGPSPAMAATLLPEIEALLDGIVASAAVITPEIVAGFPHLEVVSICLPTTKFYGLVKPTHHSILEVNGFLNM